MASYSISWRILLIVFMLDVTNLFAFAASEGNNDCFSEDKGNLDELSVKCAVQNLNDVFINFSSFHPDRVVKLKVMCDTRHELPNLKQNPHLNDDLDGLMNNTFGVLKNLRELMIEDCTLTTIPPMAFNGVSQLKNLTIRSRNYRHGKIALHLSAETFSQLQLLESLDLGENNINNLPQTLLCPLRRLETLNLTLNNFSDISSVGLSTGSRDNVLCLVDVQRVRLSYNRIKVLTSKGFAAVNQLRELRLDHNIISRAEESSLHGLDKLRVLDLGSNQIVALPPLVLRNCEELVELYLQNNSISVLPPGLFAGLQQLLVLDLSRNEVTSHWLSTDTFADLIRVVTLDISYNRLTQIDSSIFRSQYSLEVLHLDHNEIEVISDHAFSSLYKLHTLILNNNKITRVTTPMFSGLHVLNMLSLSHNDIVDVHPDAFKNNSAVMELNLADNKLAAVPTAVQSLQLLRMEIKSETLPKGSLKNCLPLEY
ncbi:tollo [Trichonephila inaurata madagascariensis]|uniref:Tollo n=1 Tax=Trichonephila inaurata madagascariensis TaxID=2747483 RepID=A0A8X6YJL4_9ARAC|nr:tollo [Trichonephila inaurata madagascariensis]